MDGYVVAAPIKNYYTGSPVLLGTNIANFTNPVVANQRNGSETSVVVYLNGTTDNIVAAVRSAVPLTSNALNDSTYFSASLISQQTISTTGTGNYMLSTSTSQSMTALIAAATAPTITDTKNNIYVINNTSSTNSVTITTPVGGGYSGYQAWPQQATATSLTIPA